MNASETAQLPGLAGKQPCGLLASWFDPLAD